MESSYCQHVVASGEPLLIEDARQHPLVRDSPRTLEEGIISYAAVPLTIGEDLILGTLCVVDFQVRSWTEQEVKLLEHLAEFVASEFQRRGRAEEEVLRLASVIESAHDAIFTTTADGEITSWNPAAEELFGYEEREILGQSRLIVVPPEEHESVRDTLKRVKRGESVRREGKRLRKDGSTVWVTLCDAPLKDLGGRNTGVSVIARDITARREAEAQIHRTQALFRSLIENAFELITVVDAEGVIHYQSPAILRILGYGSDEMLGDPFFNYVHPDDLAVMQGRLAEALERPGQKVNYETRFRSKSGEWRVLRGTGVNLLDDAAIGGIVANSQDVTEIVRAERALRESDIQYRRLVELSPDVVIVHRNEKVVYINSAGVELIGAESPEQVTGSSIFDLLHPDSWDVARRRAAVIQEMGGSTAPVEIKFIHMDGTTRHGEEIASPVVFEGEASILAIVRDLTQRRAAAEALAQSEVQLRQAQKMEAVGQLTGGIAHDFNNLMNAILGNTHFVLADLPPDSPMREDVAEIANAATRAASLTKQLLAFSRQQVLQPEVVDLNRIVSEMGRMLERLLGESIELTMHLHQDLDPVEVDPTQMHQVMLNLCVNARDAMPGGGKLTIETQNIKLDETHTSARGYPIAPGSYAMLAVSDTGEGIPHDIQERIFDPFFTTKEVGQGTGLGLSTVYGIVKQSGGYIWLYSEEGIGTTFKIYLPRAETGTPKEPVRDELPVPLPRNRTVLVVEDEQAVRRTACKTLERAGYRILQAAAPEEALRIFQQNADDIDLFLTDVVMPQMSGSELAERIRRIRPEIPILFMSGYTDEAVIRHGELAPNADFLQKPFSPAVLSRTIERMLAPVED